MCRAISPSVFLALAFQHSGKSEMRYDELEAARKKVMRLHTEKNGSYDVDWGHDSVQFTMGFYSPVFQELPDGVACNRNELKRYYRALMSGLTDEQEQDSLERAFA